MKRGRIMVNLWCLSKRDKKIVLYILVHCSIAHNLWWVMLDFFLVVWATKEVFQSWLCGVHGRNRSMGSLTGAELTESKLKELPLWRLFSCTVDFAVKSRISLASWKDPWDTDQYLVCHFPFNLIWLCLVYILCTRIVYPLFGPSR